MGRRKRGQQIALTATDFQHSLAGRDDKLHYPLQTPVIIAAQSPPPVHFPGDLIPVRNARALIFFINRFVFFQNIFRHFI